MLKMSMMAILCMLVVAQKGRNAALAALNIFSTGNVCLGLCSEKYFLNCRNG